MGCARLRAREADVRWVEYAAWAIGCSLLLAYAGARLYSETARQQGLAEFQQARIVLDRTGGPVSAASESPISVAVADPPPRIDQPPIDQSLWSSQRVRAFAASIVSPGAPLGV